MVVFPEPPFCWASVMMRPAMRIDPIHIVALQHLRRN
jgi:hypothetical protein